MSHYGVCRIMTFVALWRLSFMTFVALWRVSYYDPLRRKFCSATVFSPITPKFSAKNTEPLLSGTENRTNLVCLGHILQLFISKKLLCQMLSLFNFIHPNRNINGSIFLMYCISITEVYLSDMVQCKNMTPGIEWMQHQKPEARTPCNTQH